MKIQEFERYDASKQIEKWNQVKANLKVEDKETIALNALEGDRDIWGYLDLISEILFDIASDSNKYIQMLGMISSKVKNDMAQGPFLSSLIRIGQEKEDIAGIKNRKLVLDLIERNINLEQNPLILQSYLKAILVMNEKQKKMEKKYLKFIEKLLNKKIENVNVEILNFSLSNYDKNKSFFYKIIKSLIIENNEIYKKFLFGRLSYQDIIEEKRLFELIELSKEANEKTIDEIVMGLRRYPSQKRKILHLYFYWINKGFYFQIRNLDWVLEEIMKKDSSTLSLFIKLFRKIDKRYSYVVVPHIFESLAKNNIDLAISESIKIKPRNKTEKLIKLKLFRTIIGCCYINKDNLKRMQKLIKYLINEAKNRPYVNVNIKPELINATLLTKDKYDLLVNHTSKLIDDLEVKKKSFNYSIIEKNLKKYPYVKKYGEDIIKKCKREKRYSPLLWLLENEVPDLTKIKIEKNESEFNKAMKINFLRSKFWSRAYLT